MRGEIRDDEVWISIRLRGSNGDEVELDAILDTGFNKFLTLSLAWILYLDLPFLTTVPVRLGNKQMDETDVYEGRIFWNGQWKKIEIQDHGSEEAPLLGMAMLRDSSVLLQIIEGGEVTIEPIQ